MDWVPPRRDRRAVPCLQMSQPCASLDELGRPANSYKKERAEVPVCLLQLAHKGRVQAPFWPPAEGYR